jgi:hypothetical protein
MRRFAGPMRASVQRIVRNGTLKGCMQRTDVPLLWVLRTTLVVSLVRHLDLFIPQKPAKTVIRSFDMDVYLVARSRSLVDEVVVRNRVRGQGKGAKLSRRGACVSCFLASERRCRIRDGRLCAFTCTMREGQVSK